jgi:hypothetical protein
MISSPQQKQEQILNLFVQNIYLTELAVDTQRKKQSTSNKHKKSYISDKTSKTKQIFSSFLQN